MVQGRVLRRASSRVAAAVDRGFDASPDQAARRQHRPFGDLIGDPLGGRIKFEIENDRAGVGVVAVPRCSAVSSKIVPCSSRPAAFIRSQVSALIPTKLRRSNTCPPLLKRAPSVQPRELSVERAL